MHQKNHSLIGGHLPSHLAVQFKLHARERGVPCSELLATLVATAVGDPWLPKTRKARRPTQKPVDERNGQQLIGLYLPTELAHKFQALATSEYRTVKQQLHKIVAEYLAATSDTSQSQS